VGAAFSAVLGAAGFPGERPLDSVEFQAQAKWHEALGELARLDRISQPLPFNEAFQILKRICADTLFQPESPDTPIQVLGLLESAGVEFDHLWVTGLTDEAWPLKSSPNPFLPLAQQRKAAFPRRAPRPRSRSTGASPTAGSRPRARWCSRISPRRRP